MAPRSYQEALDAMLAYSPEDEARRLRAASQAQGRRRDADILQAGDDLAAAMSGGSYKGRDVASPMRDAAAAVEQRATDEAKDKQALLARWAAAKQQDEHQQAALAQASAEKGLDRQQRMEQWGREQLTKKEQFNREAALRRELASQASADRRASADATRAMAAASLGLKQNAADERTSDKRAQRFDRITKDLEDVRPALDSVQELEGLLEQYKGDVPGTGVVASRLPLLVSNPLDSERRAQGERFRQTLQGLKNQYFKSNAGGNVTSGEQARIERALEGVGTAEEMREGLRLLKKAFTGRYTARTAPLERQDPQLAADVAESILPPKMRGPQPKGASGIQVGTKRQLRSGGTATWDGQGWVPDA